MHIYFPLTGKESPLKTTPTKSLESGLSSSESEEVTEKGHHNQNSGGASCANLVHGHMDTW